MPNLAELEAKVVDVESKLKALEKKPVYTGIHTDEQNRLLSGWSEGGPEDVITLVDGQKYRDKHEAIRTPTAEGQMKSLIRNGYVPGSEFKSLGDFVRAGLDGHATGQFRDRCKSHFKTIQGMSEAIGADGGFTVLPEFSTKIFERVYSNDLLGRTDGYTVSGNNMTFWANAETSRVDGSRHGGLRGYWTGEGGTITASKPTLREVQIKLQKVAVVVYLTDELISDSAQALEQYVTRKASDEFNFVIGSALFRGDGVGKPLGIINAPSYLAISAETGQATKTVQTENIAKMYGRFFAPFLPGARWYHNQDVLQQLMLMTLGIGAAGVATYMPPGGMSSAPYATLGGRPTEMIEFASTLGSAGDIVLADLGQVLTISKGGMSQAVSMHVEFLTDQLALRFTMRVNGVPWENAPTTPYQGTNTQSSFVGLAAR